MRKAIFALLLLAGCDEEHVEPAVLQWEPYAAMAAVPPTARAKTTFSPGCTYEGSTEVTTEPDQAFIEPFDVRVVPDEDEGGCTRLVRFATHEGSVRFETTGEKLIRFLGRKYTSGAYEPFEVTVPITIE